MSAPNTRPTLPAPLAASLLLAASVLLVVGIAHAQERIEDAGAGVAFTVPAGWSGQPTEVGYLMGSPSLPGFVLVMAHEEASLDELRASAEQGLSAEGGTILRLDGATEAFGTNGLAAGFTGTIEGAPARAFAVSLLSPYGGGLTVLAAAAPAGFTETHRDAAATIARSVAFSAPVVPQAPAALSAGASAQTWEDGLRGCRLSYFNRYDSGYGGGGYSDETVIDLCTDYFNYGDRSDTFFNTPDLSGSDASISTRRRGAGTWSVGEEAGRPVLRLRFFDGTVQTYALGFDDGKTFLDGVRWLRTCDPNDSVVEARPQCE